MKEVVTSHQRKRRNHAIPIREVPIFGVMIYYMASKTLEGFIESMKFGFAYFLVRINEIILIEQSIQGYSESI